MGDRPLAKLAREAGWHQGVVDAAAVVTRLWTMTEGRPGAPDMAWVEDVTQALGEMSRERAEGPSSARPLRRETSRIAQQDEALEAALLEAYRDPRFQLTEGQRRLLDHHRMGDGRG